MSDGGLYRRKSDGLWVAPYRLEDGKRRYAYGITAEKALANRREKTAGSRSDQTVGEYLGWWTGTYLVRRVAAGKIAQTTVDEYAGVVRRYTGPLAHIPLAELTPRRIDAWLAELAEHPHRYATEDNPQTISSRTVAYAHETLRTALAAAVRYELLDRNPAALVEPPRRQRTPHVILTRDEARQFVRALPGDPLEALWAVLFGCGLRLGEAQALTPGDVDLDKRELRVHRSLAYRGRPPVFRLKTTKSGGDDVVALPRFAAEALTRHLEAREFQRRRAGDLWQGATLVGDHDEPVTVELLFCRADGGPLQPGVIRDALTRLCERAGVPRLTPHALRHNIASLLGALGVPLEDIRHLLRHSSSRITADIYRHLLAEVAREHVGRLDAFLEEGQE